MSDSALISVNVVEAGRVTLHERVKVRTRRKDDSYILHACVRTRVCVRARVPTINVGGQSRASQLENNAMLLFITKIF